MLPANMSYPGQRTEACPLRQFALSPGHGIRDTIPSGAYRIQGSEADKFKHPIPTGAHHENKHRQY